MKSDRNTIRIGGGAGFSGDRLEPAVALARDGELDYLVLECLAERTIALAQQKKKENPEHGYDPLLERRFSLLLPYLANSDLRIITNMGAANPVAAARCVAALAAKLDLEISVAAVTGDDVFSLLGDHLSCMETGRPITESGELISANAYLGVEAILPALESGARVIITGRVADPSLFLAPMIHEFQWDTPDMLASGTVTGHLLECGGQISGGYFMDRRRKKVENPAQIGFPLAIVNRDGTAEVTKLAGTGGRIDLHTAREQLLYEVINPYSYLTPDVDADFSTVTLALTGENIVSVQGARGKRAPATLKASVGYAAGFLGEGEITYAGHDARDRASLAAEILRERLSMQFPDLQIDLIGTGAVHRREDKITPYEIRVRVSALAESREAAERIGEEAEALYTNGPAGGGGARKYVKAVVGIHSVLIDRRNVKPELTLVTS